VACWYVCVLCVFSFCVCLCVKCVWILLYVCIVCECFVSVCASSCGVCEYFSAGYMCGT